MDYEWKKDPRTLIANVGEKFGCIDATFYPIYDLILIDKNLSPMEKELVYMHETTHRDCWHNNCHCLGKLYLGEYHAIKGELEKVLINDHPAMAKLLIHRWHQILKSNYLKPEKNDGGLATQSVIRKLMKTKLYKQVEQLAWR